MSKFGDESDKKLKQTSDKSDRDQKRRDTAKNK